MVSIYHDWCSTSADGGSITAGVVGLTTKVTAVCLFLVTILGMMPSDFTVETCIVFHEFCFLGFRVLLSSGTSGIDVGGNNGINIYIRSFLEGSPLSIAIVSSIAIAFFLALLGTHSKGFEESLLLLIVLRGSLPFVIGFSGLFLPLFESPWDIGGGVMVRGMYDCPSELLGYGVFESFNGSFVI